jgi:hypothetical protein
MKHLHLTIYIIFTVAATIILLNRYTDFYITDYRVHYFFLFFAASSFVIIIGHLFRKLRSNRSILIVFILTGAVCFAKAFLTWGGDWKTQTVLYRSLADKNKTIEFQMRADKFSFGYKKRVVGIYSLAPFMEWTTNIDTIHMDKSKWEKLNLQLNEMGLPVEH